MRELRYVQASKPRRSNPDYSQTLPWQCLNFLPEPQGHGALRAILPQVAGSLGSRAAFATRGRGNGIGSHERTPYANSQDFGAPARLTASHASRVARPNVLRDCANAALRALQEPTSRLLQFLELHLGLRGLYLHLLDRDIDVGAFRRGDLHPFGLELIGRLPPGLGLCGGDGAECRLLLFDLLSRGFKIGFDQGFKALPLRFQLSLIHPQGCFARLSGRLRLRLELFAPLLELDE